jgi:hypothetical protein
VNETYLGCCCCFGQVPVVGKHGRLGNGSPFGSAEMAVQWKLFVGQIPLEVSTCGFRPGLVCLVTEPWLVLKKKMGVG